MLENAKKTTLNVIKINTSLPWPKLYVLYNMGHIISGNGIRPDNNIIKDNLQIPNLKSKLDLQVVLGVLNYVIKFYI